MNWDCTKSTLKFSCSFCPWVLSPRYLNKLSYTIKCLENSFLTIAVDDSTSFLMACMGKVTKINTRAFMWLRKCSLPPVFAPSLFFSEEYDLKSTSWRVRPEEYNPLECALPKCSGENILLMATLRGGTCSHSPSRHRYLGYNVLGSEITLSVLPVNTCILVWHGTTLRVIGKAADLDPHVRFPPDNLVRSLEEHKIQDTSDWFLPERNHQAHYPTGAFSQRWTTPLELDHG